ncbi:MAG: LLM class flavin-dependent oxidoreductase [Gammaproteobacteria bacterium]|nr:LLM class flavin-dependent oxidoreductase [Gammaproteobacteria bacterium]
MNMINKFSSLYAGHVDLPDMGQNATPVNERRFDNDHLMTVFSKTEALAKRMDRLGYETLWLAEHHFQREGYECLPNLLMMGVHLAHLTKTLKIGCGFNVCPMWHPLRLAEDYATADILTDGRVVFGVARGYHTREVESLGGVMMSQEGNRDQFEEQVEIIFKAFNNDSFSHQGKHYTLPPKLPYRGYELEELTLVPRPKHLPVECWQPIVSANPRGLDFMVKHGIKGVVGGGSALLGEGPVVGYRDALARAGVEAELGEGLCIGINFYLADSVEQAVREATPYYEEHAKMFAPLGFFRGLTDEQVKVLSGRGGWDKAGIPTIDQQMAARSWYCGPAEGMIEYLKGLEEQFPGLEHVNVQSSMGTPESVMLEQLDRFAEEVMPAFQARAKTASAAGG